MTKGIEKAATPASECAHLDLHWTQVESTLRKECWVPGLAYHLGRVLRGMPGFARFVDSSLQDVFVWILFSL